MMSALNVPVDVFGTLNVFQEPVMRIPLRILTTVSTTG